MKYNLNLLIAFRRNQQTRGSGDFLTAINQATGLTLGKSAIVDPAYSIRAERSLDSAIHRKIIDGSLSRASELVWDEAADRINSYTAIGPNDHVYVYLCNHENFMIKINYMLLLESIKSLVTFDGDTVYAFTEHLNHGIGIDTYISELINNQRYTVDLW